MTKAAILISAVLLFAGVAAASSLTSLGGSDTPTIETPTLSTPTNGAAPQGNTQTTRDISGPCDEVEHANDPRCTGAAGAQPRGDDDHRNRGPGNGRDDDDSDNRGGNSGPGSANSGPGGDDD